MRPLIYGEILFDCFPDGNEVLGGAPFNVAWHLQGFGLSPIMISRIGTDDRGTKVLCNMKDWGMDCRGIQQDKQKPTGQAIISLKNGQPTFFLPEDQAYDAIDFQTIPAEFYKEKVLLYHGTLALRKKISTESFKELTKEIQPPIFLDVNLRNPCWNFEEVQQHLSQASWVKLNDDEASTLMDQPCLTLSDCKEVAAILQNTYHMAQLIMTRGKQGALIMNTAGESIYLIPEQVEKIVDTVGAGDAFSSVCIMGIIKGWDSQRILNRAASFASEICRHRGAIIHDTSFYQHLLTIWNNENK
jgi:fructokinase